MSKHTPRSWEVDGDIVVANPRKMTQSEALAMDYWANGFAYDIVAVGVAEANARLIAVAPDLLEAAKAVLEQAGEFEREHAHLVALSAAIKRAEGGDA